MTEATVGFILKLIAYAGGSVAVAYAVFMWLGKRLLDSWFSQRLESQKHDLNRELEHYKYKINSLFNRITKIHDKEFEVLPTAWQKLIDALSHVSVLISPLQTYPDFNLMKENQIKEFLKSSKLREYEKEELLQAKDKVDYYKESIFWHRFNDAQSCVYDLHNYLSYNKMFLSSDLCEKFKEMDDSLYKALSDAEWSKRDEDRKLIREAYKKVKEKAEPLLDEIEKLVQKRLHYEEAL